MTRTDTEIYSSGVNIVILGEQINPLENIYIYIYMQDQDVTPW